MKSKLITFHVYRYHLNPIESNSKQIELFPGNRVSVQDIKDKKNDYFKKMLTVDLRNGTPSNPMSIYDEHNDIYLLKIANIKNATIIKNFKPTIEEHEPYVYAIINNDKGVQKIAISENLDAFSNVDVVKNLLYKLFNRELLKYGLNVEIEKLFDVQDFWSYVKQYEKQITKIEFEFIKPNLASISKSIPNMFKKLQEKTNGHRAKFGIEAPKNGVLEKINKSNRDINGLVEYSSEGGGNIKMKVVGLRAYVQTAEKPVTLQIDEIDLEGAPGQLIKLYKGLLGS